MENKPNAADFDKFRSFDSVIFHAFLVSFFGPRDPPEECAPEKPSPFGG
jgi:hypothetical protein